MALRLQGAEVLKAAGETFRSLYRNPQRGYIREGMHKAFSADSEARTVDSVASFGHPLFQNLMLGESHKADAVVLFVDIGGFTKLSFALDSAQLHTLVQALTVTAINIVHENGGHVGEFTGDGVMAYFGQAGRQQEEDVKAAFATISLLFKTIKEIVNPELENQGNPTITVSAGVECGEVLWTRVGNEVISQLKPIGEATFLSGKLSTRKFTNAWECKIGPALAEWLPDDYKQVVRQYSATLGGRDYVRKLFEFLWETYGRDYLEQQDLTESRVTRFHPSPLSGIAASMMATIGSPTRQAPRKLKDQAFF